MKTNHINFADSQGKVYCFRHNRVAVLDEIFVQAYCDKCPYFAGDAQGMGIECKYSDGSKRSLVQHYDPYEAAQEGKDIRGRLGMLSDDELSEVQENQE
jgi:hypothetical protein